MPAAGMKAAISLASVSVVYRPSDMLEPPVPGKSNEDQQKGLVRALLLIVQGDVVGFNFWHTLLRGRTKMRRLYGKLELATANLTLRSTLTYTRRAKHGDSHRLASSRAPQAASRPPAYISLPRP